MSTQTEERGEEKTPNNRVVLRPFPAQCQSIQVCMGLPNVCEAELFAQVEEFVHETHSLRQIDTDVTNALFVHLMYW